MTQYDYTMLQTEEGTRIGLHELATGKTKTFWIGYPIDLDRLANHMDSLTDDLCSSWFREREKKPKKEKKTE
jgi:hypothetical protein